MYAVMIFSGKILLPTELVGPFESEKLAYDWALNRYGKTSSMWEIHELSNPNASAS